MTQDFGRFAAAPIGPGLVAHNGGLTLTTLTAGLSIARTARSDIALSSGVNGAEFAFFGDDTLVASVGLVTASASLSAAVGAAANGVGWRVDLGQVLNGGSVVASGLPVPAKQQEIGVRVSIGAPSSVTFYIGETAVHTLDVSLAGPLYFAVSLSTSTAGGLSCAVNGGQWQARGPAARAGWAQPVGASAVTRLADLDYLSANTDSPAHARYEGVVANGIITAAELGFWAWGGETPSNSASASCSVIDGEGSLDAFASGDLRGTPVRVALGSDTGTVAGAVDVARYVLDRVEIEGESSKTIILRDAHDDLDRPLSGGVFLPNIPALAWKALPVVIGAVASVPGLPANSDGTAIYLSGRPLTSVVTVMDRGDILEAGTYAVAPDQQQLEMYSPPVGPVVADVSSIGSGPAPATLTQALTAIFSAIGKESWSGADAAAIDAATGYAGIGYYDGDGATAREALAAILPSYGAWWWQDADGTLRFSRVIAPESYAGPMAFDLDKADAVDELISLPDAAPNLSRRMAYRPNAQALGASDLVTDIVDVPQSRRDELAGFWRGQVYAAGPLADRYRHADSADPFVSCFWRPEDAQAEIDRVVAMYAAPRAMYQWRVVDPELDPRPGQIGRITHPRFGLASGKKVLVRSVARNPLTGDTTLILWG